MKTIHVTNEDKKIIRDEYIRMFGEHEWYRLLEQAEMTAIRIKQKQQDKVRRGS